MHKVQARRGDRRKKFISCGRKKKLEKGGAAERKNAQRMEMEKMLGKNVQTASERRKMGWGGLGWCFLVLLCEEVEARLQCEKKNLEISATTAAADKRRRQQRAVVGVGGV